MMAMRAIVLSSVLLLACSGSSSDDVGDGGPNDSGITGDTSTTTDAPKSDVANETRADVTSETPPDAGPMATVHFIGRFDTSDPAGPRYEWSASAVVARFTGTGIDVKLKDGGTDLFEVVVDGKTSVLTPTGGT